MAAWVPEIADIITAILSLACRGGEQLRIPRVYSALSELKGKDVLLSGLYFSITGAVCYSRQIDETLRSLVAKGILVLTGRDTLVVRDDAVKEVRVRLRKKLVVGVPVPPDRIEMVLRNDVPRSRGITRYLSTLKHVPPFAGPAIKNPAQFADISNRENGAAEFPGSCPEACVRRAGRILGGFVAWFVPFFTVAAMFPGNVRVETLRITGTGGAIGGMRLLAEAFRKVEPGVEVTIPRSIGSAGGIRAAMGGKLDIGLSARPLTAEELADGGRQTAYARTAFVFAVNPDVKHSVYVGPWSPLNSSSCAMVYGRCSYCHWIF